MERVTDLALAFQDLDGVGDVILDPKTSSQLTYDDYIPRRPVCFFSSILDYTLD